MKAVKCFDVVTMVVEDASEEFRPIWRINNERLEILKSYCDIIDMMSDEFDGESFEVEVDEITMEVIISLECAEVIIESASHPFYEIIKRTVRYGFGVSEEGNLLINFTFPSLWDKD